MATSALNQPISVPTATVPNAIKRPGLLDRLRSKALHLVIIGCLGFLITAVLFVAGGMYAWNSFFGSDGTVNASARHAIAVAVPEAEQTQSDVADRRRREVQTMSAIAVPDVVYPAAGGPPDCKSIGRRLYLGTTAGGAITSYTCH